ncbi:unnamed protein product [Hyaloperonospora brassicae]|uniref:Transmembrane protein 144 n=1 Tax=Hyaloperonospora brassicae TaxID=162125 RepID=A0AAV0TAE9_HYABA|nr:unnamed protein product [Hyaloperonospora brassicae]
MSDQVVLGYIAATVAVFFFGTCYVPAKTYATYDGIIFQWFMCSGILMVGLVWGLLSNNWSQYSHSGMFTFPEGLLGGALFAIANLLIPTVVNTLGLGVGFMLWNAANITLGYCVSRLGLFGVAPTIPSMPYTSLLGIAFMLASIAVYGTIKPTLKAAKTANRRGAMYDRADCTSDGDGQDSEAKGHWGSNGSNKSTDSPAGERSLLLPQFAKSAELTSVTLTRRESLHEALVHPELPNFGPFMMPNEVGEHTELADARAEKTRKVFGMAVALLVGAFLSCCLVPFVNWNNRCLLGHLLDEHDRVPTLFALPPVRAQAIDAAQCDASRIFPISSIGPAMVSMLWSAGYFKEIQGTQNLQTLALGTVLVLIGTGLRVVSM